MQNKNEILTIAHVSKIFPMKNKNLYAVSDVSLSLERGSDEFPLGMTQEQLASVFGVHRATLARAIQHLKQEAIIACFTCRRVEIIDMERLRHMAHL